MAVKTKKESAGAAPEQERAPLQKPTQEQTAAVNEALLLATLRQHELTAKADKLNAQLHAEIAERNRVEQALREGEERYRTLFTSMDEGFCIIEVIFDESEKPVDYRFLEINPSFENQTGLKDARGKRIRELVPQHEQYWIDLYGKIALTGEAIRFESQAAAMHRWYDVYAFRVEIPESRRVGIVFNDISERKQAEEALRSSEERLASVLEHLPVGVGLFDRDGQMALTNASMRRFIGEFVPSLDLQRRHRWRACAPDGSQLEFSQWPGQRALRGETVLPGVEFCFTEDDGRETWTTIAATPLRETGGAVVMVEDIDQRKHAELALRASEERFRVAALAMSNIIWTKDAQGMMEGEQPGWAQFTGQTPEEYQGYGWARAVHPDDAQPTLDAWNAALAEKRLFEFEHRVRRHDGAWRLCSIRAMPLFGGDGRVREWVGVHNDITVRKDIEAELRTAKAVAEKASRAKSDFLSSMSHELRTPLNAILGFAQLIEAGSPPPTPSQKRSIDQILKGGWYLLDLINEILDLALIEAGKVTLSQEPVSLFEVMLECRATVEHQAEKRGISLTFPRFVRPCFISADRTRVKQVLINLLFNAIRYNKPGGTVAVEYTLKPPHSIRICVRDTGAGLAPAQLAQLFQPFNRLGKESGAEEGTGIGLVVTKRLVEMMGGTIGADSTVGVGSVFWIELGVTAAPRYAVADAAHAEPARPQIVDGTRPRTLLYVEDNPANLELVEELIARRPDLRLLSAADGDSGIEFARTSQPEVIVMDINLPGISGSEAMEILRQDPLTAHIPIIALSANALPRDIEKGLAAGFLKYITKPIRVNELMDALDLALAFSETAAATSARRADKKEPA
ncbi:MAG: PAS domain S-box protein [Burkholderiales bacterium]